MIGIYGGSFDPVHLGHLQTALSVKKELDLEKCLLMPCASPVHKNGLHYSDNERIKMLNLALQDYPELEVNLIEIKRGGHSYTIDTLKDLAQTQPDEIICLIIGMDSFAQFKSWKCWREFANYVHLIVLPRPNYQNNSLSLAPFQTTTEKQLLSKQQHGLLYFASSPLIDISSSDIRCKMAANKSLNDFLPETIINYLHQT
jgi:nicotinate-nucleotide adenylyltransferase